MPELDLDVAPPTLATFDEACEAVGADPEEVRAGEATPDLAAGDAETARALLGALCLNSAPLAALTEDELSVTAREVGRLFFSRAARAMKEAVAEAKRQGENAAVWAVIRRQSGSGVPLGRQLTRLDVDAYERIYHHMPLAAAMRYLMLRSVDHVSKNFEDYARS